MQYKEICSLIIIKKVSMVAILESLEFKSSAQMVRRVISVIPNRCGLKVNEKTSTQTDPECNAALDRKPLSDVIVALFRLPFTELT